MARNVYQDDEFGWTYPDEDPGAVTAPTYPAPAPAAAPPQTMFVQPTGDISRSIEGYFPMGNTWMPVYFDLNTKRYYTKAPGATEYIGWDGNPATLVTGEGPNAMPTWPAGQTQPSGSGEEQTGSFDDFGGGGAPTGSPVGSLEMPEDPGTFYFPEFQPPSYTPIDPFSYESFAAPTLQDARNEPGYAFAMDQGRKALENSAAARGTLRSGGTMKDLFSWGNQFGEQNYSNVYNRAANTYNVNRNNAADIWGKANNQTLDTYDIGYRGEKDRHTSQFDAARLTFDDLYRRWRDVLSANTSIATNPGATT